jgi:C-terminal processing protease CtpA/Prc
MNRAATLTVWLIVALFVVPGETPARANMAPPVHEFHVGLTLERTAEGFRVTAVEKGSPAGRVMMKVGDLILGIDARYWKKFTDADIKSFVNDVHTWPITLIVLRTDGESIETIAIEP